MKILIDDVKLNLLLETKKSFIGKNVAWDSFLSAFSFLISVLLASYRDFFGLPGIALKTVFVVLGVGFTFKSLADIHDSSKNNYSYSDLLSDINKLNEITHNHSIVIIKDTFNRYPNRLLVYDDTRWNCKFFLNYADAAGNTVIYMVPNYQIDGKTGTWLPYDSEVVEGVCFFMMRNEQRKDAVSPVVVDSKGVFVTDAPNGFENVRSTLTEYVQRAEKKQQDMTEHEKCLTNGTYERARESGTEQNYDMIDGCVNNVPKKPRRIGGRWSVLDRLHIKQAQRKQKDQTQQQQQERSRKN